ncbi:cobalamin-binding protein [Acidaminobacter sp. JC074]|uniref:corrinoid protein n=1 Tax=Acidaminobacter sp. JC074 TaxID=2530199 RepID=UPI001F0E75C4|nr:corrinoid protein [Acidaminobacter sp. JC074]MCH4887551.1 cobalamin-binding protein [Acidaminobacter sp. JC074]
MYLEEMGQALTKGQSNEVMDYVSKAIDAGVDVKIILNEGLLHAMSALGERFKKNEVFVPEVLIAARAMNAGLSVLEPFLVGSDVKPTGKVILGTVKGDLHDIGKNLVGMMLKGAGFEVVDLGVNVDSDKFISKAEELGADIICMSALLTTTMNNMKTVIDELEQKGLREKYVVMIGGAPVTSQFASQIGADAFTTDAASCAAKAKELVN